MFVIVYTCKQNTVGRIVDTIDKSEASVQMSSFPQFPRSDKFNPALFASDTDTFTLASADLRYVRIGSDAFLSNVSCSSLTINGSVLDVAPITGITYGTAQADKAIVLDSFRDISDVNNINSTGRFSMVNTDYGLSHRYSTGGTCELISYNSGSDATFGTYSNHPFSLTTNFIPRVTINSGGNVSIGNANNTYKLDVEGTLMTNGLKIRSTGSLNFDTPNFTIRARNGAGFDSGLQIAADAQGLLNVSNIGFWSSAFATPILYLSSYNQACAHFRPLATDIGQTMPDVGLCCGDNAIFRDGVIISSMPLSNTNNKNPQTKLRVIGDSNYLDGSYQKVAEFCNQTYTNTLSIQCSTTSGDPVFLGTTTNSELRLGVNNSTRMTIDTSGYVGIGTSSPRCPLEVANSQLVALNLNMLSTVYRKRTDSSALETSTNQVNYNFSCWLSEYLYCKAVAMVSDKRMKTDIIDINQEHVSRFYEVIKPKTYYFKSNPTKIEYGIIAQECIKENYMDLISVIPNDEMKVEDEEVDIGGVQFGIDYQKITIFNMTTIQSLLKEIKELKKVVEALTSKPALAKWLSKN